MLSSRTTSSTTSCASTTGSRSSISRDPLGQALADAWVGRYDVLLVWALDLLGAILALSSRLRSAN
jgi:DNA invertase Pin-like site-specific DNA recombinase